MIDFEALVADPTQLLEYAKLSYLSTNLTLPLYSDIVLMRFVELEVTKNRLTGRDYSQLLQKEHERMQPYKPELIAMIVQATKIRKLDDIL